MSSGSREFALGLFVNLMTSRPLVGTFSHSVQLRSATKSNWEAVPTGSSSPQLQGGLRKRRKRSFSVNSVHISKMSIFQPTSFVTEETRMLRNRVFLT